MRFFHTSLFLHIFLHFNLQTSKCAKYADTLKIKSGDLKNNIFTGKIMLNNIKKDIEGITIRFNYHCVLQYKYSFNAISSNFPDTTSELNQYSNDNRRIEIKKALKAGKMILNHLKSVNIAPRIMEVEDFLE